MLAILSPPSVWATRLLLTGGMSSFYLVAFIARLSSMTGRKMACTVCCWQALTRSRPVSLQRGTSEPCLLDTRDVPHWLRWWSQTSWSMLSHLLPYCLVLPSSLPRTFSPLLPPPDFPPILRPSSPCTYLLVRLFDWYPAISRSKAPLINTIQKSNNNKQFTSGILRRPFP